MLFASFKVDFHKLFELFTSILSLLFPQLFLYHVWDCH